MTGLLPLLKKELKEQWRTHKYLIVGGIFVFFGLTTPLMLKFLPQILELSGTQGMEISIPAPTGVQSLTEYTSTIGQIGAMVAVLITMGCIANELRHGTGIITLSKPVSRAAFVTSKLLAVSLTFVLSLVAASAICYLYTVLLIGGSALTGFIGQNALLLLFLIFCLSVTILFSSLFSSSLAAGGTAIAVIIAQAGISAIPGIGNYLPGKLLSWGYLLTAGSPGTYWWALAITVIIILVCLYSAQSILNRKDI